MVSCGVDFDLGTDTSIAMTLETVVCVGVVSVVEDVGSDLDRSSQTVMERLLNQRHCCFPLRTACEIADLRCYSEASRVLRMLGCFKIHVL
jgi:hypothetical protein